MHSSLRSINFWRVILVNLMVSAFVYMLMPLWPLMQYAKDGVPLSDSGLAMILFCVGLFMPGPFGSYLVDRYRRKDVCMWTICILVSVSLLATLDLPIYLIGLLRFVQGISFSLFHIVLGSTILIDITISERRDLASYIYFWNSRLALALGPAFGILALKPELWTYLKYFPFCCAALSIYLVARINLPFRSPLEPKLFSFDRFWLNNGWPFALLLFPVVFALGIEMASNLHPLFFVFLLTGFVISLLLHVMVFYRSDIRAEIFTGYVALIAAFILLVMQDEELMVRVAAGLTGYGVGCVSGRLQYFLTKISKHTERGSAQGTYKLTFESGLCLGFCLACAIGRDNLMMVNYLCLFMIVLALVLYLLVVHRWYLKHALR